MKNAFVSVPARPALISSSVRVSLPLEPILSVVPVATAPFSPPRPPVAQPEPFANGVEVKPSPRVELFSAGFGVLTAVEAVVVKDGNDVAGTDDGDCPRVRVSPDADTGAVIVLNMPPVRAVEVVAAGVLPKSPPVDGAEDVAAGAGVVPKSPPAAEEAFVAAVPVLPNKPPAAGAVVAAGAVLPNKPPAAGAVEDVVRVAAGAVLSNPADEGAVVVELVPNNPPVAVVAAGAAPNSPVAGAVADVVGAELAELNRPPVGLALAPKSPPLGCEVTAVSAGAPKRPVGAADVVAAVAVGPKSPPGAGLADPKRAPAGAFPASGFETTAEPNKPAAGAAVVAEFPNRPDEGALVVVDGAPNKFEELV